MPDDVGGSVLLLVETPLIELGLLLPSIRNVLRLEQNDLHVGSAIPVNVLKHELATAGCWVPVSVWIWNKSNLGEI